MLGGGLGTGLRVALATWFTARYGEGFPLGTLVVNVSGCLLIGVFSAVTESGGPMAVSVLTRQVVMLGVLGGYTTFSSFGLQTFALSQAGDWARASLYAALSLFLCLAAVWVGNGLAGLFQTR